MGNNISETLELMCDKSNPQDKKILLLAELVENRCSALAQNQGELKKSLSETNDKLDKLTQLLEGYRDTTQECPVYKNKEGYEKLSFYLKNPKLTIVILLGLLAILGGFFGSSAVSLIKTLVGLV